MDDLDLLDLLEEHANLVTELKGGNTDPLDELDMLERVAEIVVLLGGKADEPQPTAEPSELATILDSLQSGVTDPIDLDFNHLAELSATGDDETLTQIRQIIDSELANEWQNQLVEVA